MKNTLQYILFTTVVFSSCISDNNKENGKRAKMVIDRYYGFVKRHSYDSIKTIVTPDFFGKSDSKEMISILEKMQNDFGDIIEADCENSKYEYFFTGGKQENRIELTYKVKYANNHFNTDVFTFKFNSNFNGKIYGIRFVQ